MNARDRDVSHTDISIMASAYFYFLNYFHIQDMDNLWCIRSYWFEDNKRLISSWAFRVRQFIIDYSDFLRIMFQCSWKWSSAKLAFENFPVDCVAERSSSRYPFRGDPLIETHHMNISNWSFTFTRRKQRIVFCINFLQTNPTNWKI